MTRYQPFNDLPAAQFQGLVDDISKRGVLLPIIVDENGQTIDGHQRRRAAAEAGVECPQVVVEGLTDSEKETLALVVNLYRRHLSGVERSKAIQQLVNLGMSTRRMADVLGVSKSTVHNDLRELSNSGQLEDRPERVESADGKSRPASMPKRPPKNVDPETGEIVAGEDRPSATGSGAGEDVAPGQTREASSPSPASATSGSDQSADAIPDAAGPDVDQQAQAEPAPSPAPKVAPSIPTVECPTCGGSGVVSAGAA